MTAKRVREAARDLPASWVQAGNRLPVEGVPARGRGYYSAGYAGRPARILAKTLSTALHEYVHHLQRAIPELNARFTELHRRRTQGDPVVPVIPNQPDLKRETGRPDDYVHPYSGREYNGDPLEVMTMAFQQQQHLIHGDEFLDRLLDKDLEMLDLAVGALFKFDQDNG